jgi:hypothetical protein
MDQDHRGEARAQLCPYSKGFTRPQQAA